MVYGGVVWHGAAPSLEVNPAPITTTACEVDAGEIIKTVSGWNIL